MKKINVVVWSEYRHERKPGAAQNTYPNGLHAAIKAFLEVNEDMEVSIAALDAPDQGLPDERLENTDVLIWWGHMAHKEVSDVLAEKIREDGREYITIYYGQDIKEKHAQKAADLFAELCPDADVNLLPGGQPVYAYIISGEDA